MSTANTLTHVHGLQKLLTMMGMLVPGRGEERKQGYFCNQPGCTATARGFETPVPVCPLHGVPMKKRKKLRKR
jgi:hypothetical protein